MVINVNLNVCMGGYEGFSMYVVDMCNKYFKSCSFMGFKVFRGLIKCFNGCLGI